MRLQLRKPTQSLGKAYAQSAITQNQMDAFQEALAKLFLGLDEHGSEDDQKNRVAQFLTDTFYPGMAEIRPQPPVDLILHGVSGSADVVVQVKKFYAGEMLTPIKNNVRALHELILYYFDACEQDPQTTPRHLIITDIYNWFIFDETDFRRFFYANARLKKLHQLKVRQQKDEQYFYAETARALRELDADIPVTYLNLREAADKLTLRQDQRNHQLLPIYKLFSPTHLFKRPADPAYATPNPRFYAELLHIAGLHETADARQARRGGLRRNRIERLPEGERLNGSLVELTIQHIQATNALAGIDNPEYYGTTETDQLVRVAVEVVITWLNRLLLLKVLESQLVRQHGGDTSWQFLTAAHIQRFADLNDLFFNVLAVPETQRSADVVRRFDRNRPAPIPFLGRQLFAPTRLEQVVTPGMLDSQSQLPLFGQTILIEGDDNPPSGPWLTLRYLLTFLEAYDISAANLPDVRTEHKPLIDAVQLGIVLEKFTGYPDGTWIMPGFWQTYLVRDVLRRTVLARFNAHFAGQSSRDAQSFGSIEELSNYLRQLHKPADLLSLNAVANAIRILDPAAGSGLLLMSALNELIALKAELTLLVDQEGRRLHQLDVSVVQDELVITNEEGERLEMGAVEPYKTSFSPVERHRIQTTILHEKQTIMANCLFGVDRQASAVISCRFRLYLELMKSMSFADGTSVPVLPTMNIRVGDSLVSHFGPDFRFDSLRNPAVRETLMGAFQQYRAGRLTQKGAENETDQQDAGPFWALLDQLVSAGQKDVTDIRQLEAKIAQLALLVDLFGHESQLQNLTDQLAIKKAQFAAKQRVFRQATEWRFAFPEVLDNVGNYVGFDVVVSNPPFLRPDESGYYKARLRKAFPNTYANKADLYVMFVELGLNVLRPDGQLAYCLPARWMRAGAGAKLRKWLKTKAIEQIVTSGDALVADKSMPDVSVLTVSKTNASGTFRFARVLNPASSWPEQTDVMAEQTVDVEVASLPDTGWLLGL